MMITEFDCDIDRLRTHADAKLLPDDLKLSSAALE